MVEPEGGVQQVHPLAIYTSALGRGGAERAMLNLANALAAEDQPVDVLVADREASDYLPLLDSAVSLVDLDASPAVLGLPGIVRYLRKSRPSALVTVELRAHALSLAARRLARVDTMGVASVQNFHSREYASGVSLGRRMTLDAMKWVLPRMDRVFAVSGRVADDVVQSFGADPDTVTVVPNPIVTPEIVRRAREPVDHPWFETDAGPVVLSIGRLSRQKNYPLLLRAFSRIEEDLDARLIILGEGSERERIESLVGELRLEDRVDLPGFVDNPYAFLARSAVFVLSSDWEGLPSVVIESLAVGCPVVSTDCPSGPREILDGGCYGRLVEPGDEKALASAMREALVTESSEPERLKQRAREYSASEVAARYVEELQLADERGASR